MGLYLERRLRSAILCRGDGRGSSVYGLQSVVDTSAIIPISSSHLYFSFSFSFSFSHRSSLSVTIETHHRKKNKEIRHKEEPEKSYGGRLQSKKVRFVGVESRKMKVQESNLSLCFVCLKILRVFSGS